MKKSFFKLRFITKAFLFFVGSILFSTCIEPYNPKLDEYGSLLVVEGMITNANSSSIIRLTRTFQNENSDPAVINDAKVYVSDDEGNTNTLTNDGNGNYKTDLSFTGVVGRTYVLHITTSEGRNYESDHCLMNPVPEIDSIYYLKDQQLFSNKTIALDGLGIYLDSKAESGDRYYHWTYEETWKFKVPHLKKFDYVHTPGYPDDPSFRQIKDPKEVCWKSHLSDEVLIRSTGSGDGSSLRKQPIAFIPTGLTDKLLLQYTILVNQYSISKSEYEFWKNLIKLDETGDDIFARQPYSVQGNIHCTTNAKERVLGYFQVSAVSSRRKNIQYDDIDLMGLPIYYYPCKELLLDKSFLPPPCPFCPPPTWDDLYLRLCILNDYIFTSPVLSFGHIVQLGFTRPECANCELTGSHTAPDFWKELEW